MVSSATPGGVLDRAIDAEEAQHKDFLRLVSHGLTLIKFTFYLLPKDFYFNNSPVLAAKNFLH